MNKSIRFYLMVLFVMASARIYSQSATIPEFTLFKENKSTFTNKNLDTEKLLLFVFFDVRCEHCLQAIRQINKQYSELDNTFIHLVTLDKPEEVNKFLRANGKNLIDKKNVTLFFDLKNEFIIRFKPRKYPSLFLYSPQRKLLIYDDNPENLPKFFDKIKTWPK